MMNIVALAMLLSSLGSAIVLSPEPMLVRSSEDGESPLQAVKEAAQGTFLKAEETVVAAKDTVVKGVEGVTKPVEKGLGWFRKKPKPEDHLAAAREKAADAREAFREASAQLKDAAVGKSAEAFHETGKYVGEKTSQAVGSVKDVAGTAEGWVEDGAHAAYKKAADVKDGTYNAAAAAVHKVGSSIQRTVSKAKEGVSDMQESAAETVGSAKETTKDKLRDVKDKVGNVKDKVSEGAENAHDAVVENVQFGVDKTKGTATDAAEKAKEAGELAVHETKEAGHGILEKVKDAACLTAECIKARAKEAGSYLPLVGQGVGYVYNDGKAGGGDAAASLKEKVSNAADTAKKSAGQSYDAAKDTAGEYYQEGRDWVEDRFDSGRETAGEYYDEAGRRYRRARDYYDAPNDFYRGRSGRNRYRGAASRYYDEEAEDLNDRARYAYRGARDRAGDYYDEARDRMGGYIPGRHQESPRDYYGSWRRSARDEDHSPKFKPGDELGKVVESMGWRRVGKVPPDHVSVSSSKEVVIGNVKYVWPQGKGQPPIDELHDTVFHHMTDTVKDAAHTVGAKLGFVKEKGKESAENVGDSGGRAKDQAYDTLRDGRSWAGRPFYREYEDDQNGEEGEDSILTKGARNLKEGVKNAGQAYEEQRAKAGEYADEARQELSSFAGYGEEGKVSDYQRKDVSKSLRSWKAVFMRKPVGFLLALTRALHLFTFSTVYGSAFWVTFVSGMILSKHVPRQQFGYVQSRMFPVYLRILAVGEGVLLLLHSLMHPWFSADSVERMQLLNFVVTIASTLLNAYVVEPRATKVMFERLKVEKEEGRGLENAANPLDAQQLMDGQKKKLNIINEQFKTLHGYSSALNLISLGGLTCHLWHLANRLVV